MDAVEKTVVVSTGVCGDCHSVHSTRVHHRDFPDVTGEGESLEQAAVGLINQFRRIFDSAGDPWRREPVRNAVADVQAFIARNEIPD